MMLSSHKEKKKSQCYNQTLTRWAGRSKCSCLMPYLSQASETYSVTSGLQSLIDVPDFREQRGKLLVLEAESKNLLRVDAT